MTNKNKEITDKSSQRKAKRNHKSKRLIDESATKILHLSYENNCNRKAAANGKNRAFMNVDYTNLSGEDQYFLGQTVDLVETLSVLLNETVS